MGPDRVSRVANRSMSATLGLVLRVRSSRHVERAQEYDLLLFVVANGRGPLAPRRDLLPPIERRHAKVDIGVTERRVGGTSSQDIMAAGQAAGCMALSQHPPVVLADTAMCTSLHKHRPK